jgi:transaldolase
MSTQPETSSHLGLDRSGPLVQLALRDHSQLIADSILNPEIRGKLHKVVGNSIRRLNFEFLKDPISREKAYEVLIEMAFNLLGVESRKIGFSEGEINATLKSVIQALREWENIEREESGSAEFARVAIQKLLQRMRQVRGGQSMVAMMVEEIEKEIDEDRLMDSFISAIGKAIKENIYYRIVTGGVSKLGNDSATGLRRLRHLGAVQVSCNPVIAARAYEEFPDLWDDFEEVVKDHPEWFDDPDKFGDEIALYGTISSLLSSWLVFRPIFLSSDLHDGLVSYQLNPAVAASLNSSMRDAMEIYSILQEILEKYDAHLIGKTDLEGRGRPNIVFKVAACDHSAIDITRTLTKMGIGTNNTVTYTVAQEVQLILAEMEGMSEATKMGIPITQVYETNMQGRLEDHLREIEAERLLKEGLQKAEDREKHLRKLAEELGVLEYAEKVDSVEKKISIICASKLLKDLHLTFTPNTPYIKGPSYGRALTDTRFVNALQELCGKSKDLPALLSQLEEDIHWAGIYVTRRVYNIFFSQENKPKWVAYLQKEFEVSREKAEEIVDKIDVLSSSKRRAEDTYRTLGGITNLTNTEFPDHQVKVWRMARQEGFELSGFKKSIAEEPEIKTLERLLKIEDFRKAYELTPNLSRRLKQVGIEGDFGEGGTRPEEWPKYGPVVKTMKEFSTAYINFKQKTIDFVRKTAQKSDQN